MIAADTSSVIAYLAGAAGADVATLDAALRDRQPTDTGSVPGRSARGVSERSAALELGDALIEQSCLDHEVRLITRDRDFQLFARAAGLKITT